MFRQRYFCLLMMFILLLSGCGSKEQSKGIKTNNDSVSSLTIPDSIEKYLSKTIEDLSEALGAAPEVENQQNGEKGYPERAFFEFRGDPHVYGDLSIDDVLSEFTDDPKLYISRISIELPYENIADISENDDAETVKKKLKDAGIEFEVISDEAIRYEHKGYIYEVALFREGNRADQLQITQNPDKVASERFEGYCAALPGGYYLDNGDYIVTTDKGLVQIYKNKFGYTRYDEKPNGTLEKTTEGLFFTLEGGEIKFLIDQKSGDLALVNDSNSPATGANPGMPTVQDPLLVKFKEDVEKYQQYALEKWGYDTKRFYDVADFNNDGTLELFSIINLSSPTPGTMRQSKLEIYTLKNNEITYLNSFTAAEPIVNGETEFTNYYMGTVPGEGDYFIIDEVNTRMGAGHSLRVGRLEQRDKFTEIDSIEFTYPNIDLSNGEALTDYPRASELLAKYGVNYDNLLIGLDVDYSLLFGFAYNDGGNSYDYFKQLLSGEKDNEILYRLTGEMN